MKTKLLILALCVSAIAAAPAQTFVEGKNAAGSTRTQNPVVIGGEDSGGVTRVLKLNSDGTLSITLSALTFAAPQHVIVDSLPSLPAGSNAIGSVTVSNFPGTVNIGAGLPAGSNTIGKVDIGALPTGTQAHSTALEASRVLKSSAGVLISVAVTNTKATDQYVQLFDSATVPADTAVPLIAFKVPASDARSYDIPITGLTFSSGIAISNSSTQATKTIGSADCLFLAEVK